MIQIQYSNADYDALAAQFISVDLLKKETRLYKTKWWDYKPLIHMEATYLFAESFKRAIKEAIKRRKCLYRGNNFKGLKHHDFLSCSKAVITGMWKARQMADTLGIDYDFYCNKAMKYAEDRDRRFLPSPSQLYSSKPTQKGGISLVEYIASEWEKVNANRLMHSRNAFYMIDAFTSNRYQIEHQRFLLNVLKNRSSMRYVLVAELVFAKRLIFEEVILDAFEDGESLIRQARKFHF